MKKTTQATVTVGIDTIRTILATAMSAGVGQGDPQKVQFSIGEKDDGYGFPESGTQVLQKVTLLVPGAHRSVGGLDVVPETTVEMDTTEILDAIAEHVAKELEVQVSQSDVRLYITPRHQGDFGYEGPFLDRAVIAVKNI